MVRWAPPTSQSIVGKRIAAYVALARRRLRRHTGRRSYWRHLDYQLIGWIVSLLAHDCPEPAIVATLEMNPRTVGDLWASSGPHGQRLHEATVRPSAQRHIPLSLGTAGTPNPPSGSQDRARGGRLSTWSAASTISASITIPCGSLCTLSRDVESSGGGCSAHRQWRSASPITAGQCWNC